MKKIILTAILSIFLISPHALASEKGSGGYKSDKSSMTEKAKMKSEMTISKPKAQAAMMKYIAKRSGENGEYDLDGTKTMFGYLHKGLKPKGNAYVSCVDYTAGDDVYDVDYYVEKKGSKYHVTKEVLHKKNGEKINKVLYMKK